MALALATLAVAGTWDTTAEQLPQQKPQIRHIAHLGNGATLRAYTDPLNGNICYVGVASEDITSTPMMGISCVPGRLPTPEKAP